MLQVAELPSIDMVRIVNGRADNASVDTTSGEHGKRAFGFISLLKKFEHTVRITSPFGSSTPLIKVYIAPRHVLPRQLNGGGQDIGALGTPRIS